MKPYRLSLYATFLSLLIASIVSAEQLDKSITAIAALGYVCIILAPSATRSFRYLDWMITTPLILYLYLQKTSKDGIVSDRYPLIAVVNALMIFSGWIGGHLYYAGLVFYVVLMYLLWQETEKMKGLYPVFASVWGLYGLAYLLPDTKRNMSYNLLDVVSKVGFTTFLMGVE